MKSVILLFLLVTSHLYAQMPASLMGRDSIPAIFPPDLPDQMPNARPNNSFYRYQLEPTNTTRATVDNMPVHIPDSSVNYTILRSYQNNWPQDPQHQRFLRPVPPVYPKNGRRR